MEAAKSNPRVKTANDILRQHLREVMERHRLPSPPMVVTKVVHMLKDPDFNVRELSRVISDDTSLACRILAISHSARYAQRHQPTTVHQAILVLGLHAIRNIVIATAAQSFLAKNSKISEKLWSHSLAVALAARMLSQRSRFGDSELAFLAGLLHDVGEMILLHGDPKGFEKILDEVREAKGSMIQKEKEMYGFDHCSVGVALLDFWNIDSGITEAVLCHHTQEDLAEPNSLVMILCMADYLACKADLAFFSEPSVPASSVIRAFGCEDAESLDALVQEVRQAFDQESTLFKN